MGSGNRGGCCVCQTCTVPAADPALIDGPSLVTAGWGISSPRVRKQRLWSQAWACHLLDVTSNKLCNFLSFSFLLCRVG